MESILCRVISVLYSCLLRFSHNVFSNPMRNKLNREKRKKNHEKLNKSERLHFHKSKSCLQITAKMSFRPRERVVSVIRKLFKTSEEKTDRDAGNDRGGTAKSPVRRSRR